MFLRYFVVVPRPYADVEHALASGTENWLPDLALLADGHAMKLLSDLGVSVASHRFAKKIQVEVSEPRHFTGATLLSLRWQSASASGLFPTLDGQLEIAPIGPASTQLGLSGSYEPPLGALGRVADRALMHRVAELTVKDFLDRIGERLAHTAAAVPDAVSTVA